jgi:outer membrane immunogenic protein
VKFIVAALMFALAGGQALAADLPMPAPLPGAKYFPTATYNWGGGYFGLNGGYGFGTSEWTLAGVSTGSFNVNGFLFGATLGANFQTGQWVLGLEGDFDWSDITGSSSVAGCTAIGAPVGSACQTKSANWLSTGRGRVGYAFDRILLYATGGLALTNVQLALTQPAVSDSNVEGGWTAGAGIEFAFADNWTAKAEYLFVDFGKITCVVSLPVCGTGTVSLTENIVRAGINYKFYW